MNVLRVLFAVVVSAALLLAAPLATAGQAPPIFPHRHFLVTPQGEIPVGPQVCEKPSLQSAFNEFHSHVHVGPANDAFDHEHNPVNIISRLC